MQHQFVIPRENGAMRGLVAAMGSLRRALNRQVRVQALIELAVWLALPYIIVGLGWAFTPGDKVREHETDWNNVLPAGAELAAFGEATAVWPALLLLPPTCGAAAGERPG